MLQSAAELQYYPQGFCLHCLHQHASPVLIESRAYADWPLQKSAAHALTCAQRQLQQSPGTAAAPRPPVSGSPL
eukprot:11399-Heterococcus_DN1.PRE.4